MKSSFSKEECALLSMLAKSLSQNQGELSRQINDDAGQDNSQNEPDYGVILELAGAHKVLSIAYNEFIKLPLSEQQRKVVASTAKTTVAQNLRLLFLDKYVTGILEKAGVAVVVLKGMVTAAYYKEPLYRKSGDVDLLLLDKSKLETAKKTLCDAGFSMADNQPSLHHIVFDSAEGIEIELHTELAEPFDNKEMNRYMDEVMLQYGTETVSEMVCEVSLPALSPAYHAYELLLHMLQHFLRAGFGLKLLCDWVVFWNHERNKTDQDTYLRLVTACGLKRFSDQVTRVCIDYLGLEESKVTFMQLAVDDAEAFMKETLEAEEFGKSSKDRMVALRGGKLSDYVREFHHQMRLNYPGAGKCFLLWPVLWIMTLVRFLRNNRKLKRPSAKEILKKAGERGRIIENLELFQVKNNPK